MSLYRISTSPASRRLIHLIVTNSPRELRELYDKEQLSDPAVTVWYPENTRNGVELQQYANEVLPGTIIVTGSVFLYREFALCSRPVLYHGVKFQPGKEHPVVVSSTDPLGFDLEILDREVEQSQRYLEAQATTSLPPSVHPESPFECLNCGYRPTPHEVVEQQGDCPKCQGTVLAHTVDVAEALVRATANRSPQPTQS